ncbi:TniQ family protein [Tateyamaria sp. SN6-1]|uniref:TniQ family protein n=1 Tax=Tateyamaria sp. SN6-1 TaxID=3092148 RepID=UPI0039F5443D
MYGIQPLPLQISSRENECATSCAARTAYRNGAPRLVTFCSDVGIRYLPLANGDEDEIRLLATLAGHDPEPLIRNTPKVIRKDWFKLGAADIKFSAFRRTKPRVCPICISEHGPQNRQNTAYQTGLLQLLSVRTCMKHQSVLQDLPNAEGVGAAL